MPEVLDADAVRRWSATAVELLRAGCRDIDALNVFPVPDGDTGTNMLTTLRAADAALARADARQAGPALAAMAEGAAAGAVGNSGFILSQVLRGLAEAAVAAGRWDADALAAGLLAGAELGRQAVMNPVEGTILSVAAAAAVHARGHTLADVVSAAVAGADAALLLTPHQLPELARAGVVDAGGRGLLVLLDALARTVTGAPAALSPLTVAAPVRGTAPPDPPAGPGYEVQYLLDSTPAEVAALRAALDDLGDSVAVVGAGEHTWKVHVHVDDIGAALERGLEAGRPHGVSVVALDGPRRPEDGGVRAVLAVAPGAGLAHLFETEGVHVVEGRLSAEGGPGGGELPTTADVLDAVRATGAHELVLLPNASQITGVAEAAARLARARGLRVSVVPTRSPVQGLAAIAVHDPARRFDDDVVAMAEAAAATRFAQVTIAHSQALTAVGICQPGDVLGMIDGEVVAIGRGLLAVAFGLVDRLLAVGAELMTVVVGTGAPARTGELIEAHVRGRAPLTDVSVYQGGQPDQPVIIGVE